MLTANYVILLFYEIENSASVVVQKGFRAFHWQYNTTLNEQIKNISFELRRIVMHLTTVNSVYAELCYCFLTIYSTLKIGFFDLFSMKIKSIKY